MRPAHAENPYCTIIQERRHMIGLDETECEQERWREKYEDSTNGQMWQNVNICIIQVKSVCMFMLLFFRVFCRYGNFITRTLMKTR